MTSYTAIANGDIDQDSPVTQPLVTALRDNPIAIAEGASGAPRIEPIAFAANYYTAGAIGTYVWARRTTGSTDVAFGDTLAGSSLSPTSAAYFIADSGATGVAVNVGSALSGTWRAMGTYDHTASFNDGSGTATIGGSTLWLRIS
jgi:hypothetical protein